MDGRPNMFITLTVNPAIGEDPAERARIVTKGFRLLVQRIKTKLKVKEFAYMAIFEATKKGEPHLHVLARSRYIPQSWLSDVWRELTGAYIVDVRRTDNSGRAAWYVTKYMAKNPVRFGKTKRYLMSRHWKQSPKKTNDKPFWKTVQINVINLSVARLVVDFKAAGWSLVSSSLDGAEWLRPPGAGPPPVGPL